LENLLGRGLFSANGHFDLTPGQRFLVFLAVTRCSGQPVPLLQYLGQINGLPGFPSAMPNRTVQPDAAGDNVNVVVRGVLVANGKELVVVPVEAHAVHVVIDDRPPLIVGQSLTRWQSQRGVPNRPGNVGAQLSGNCKF